MHLNALYRAAQAGKQAIRDCTDALGNAAKWSGYAPRALAGKPLKYWHVRQARQHLGDAKRHLTIVRDNVKSVAALDHPVKIDSSGGYAVADLLAGGLLDALYDLEIDRELGRAQAILDALDAQLDVLMMRMRKAGAVG